MSNSLLIGFLLSAVLLVLIFFLTPYRKCKKDHDTQKKEGYKNLIKDDLVNREYLEYITNNGKYRIGSKKYEFDFIPGEQPINGLGPNYEQNYPSTLPASNRLIVDQNLNVKYSDLLNNQVI
jgi:hypothetical protein